MIAAAALAATVLAAMLLAVSLSPARAPSPARVATVRLAGPPPMTTLPTPERSRPSEPGLRLDVHSVEATSLRDKVLSAVELSTQSNSVDEPPEPEGDPGTGESTPETTPQLTPEPTVAPSPTPDATTIPLATPEASSGLLDLMHAYIDLQRELVGLGALARSAELDAVAASHAADLAASGRFSHTGSDGATLADRLARGGVEYGWAGENLGRSAEANADSLRAIVSGFMNSPAHRANVLGGRFEAIGIALDIAIDGSAILVVVFSD